MTPPEAVPIRAWLHEHYGLPEVVAIEVSAAGTNNQSFIVTTDRVAYVLKRYRNAGIDTRLPFEHALLAALAGANLPFAVPVPVQTLLGATTVIIHHDDDAWRLALFTRIAGREPVFGNVDEAEQGGEALASLDRALHAVRLDPAVMVPETFAALSAVHDLVPNPRFAVGRLFGSGARAIVLSDVMAHAEEAWERLTESWSPQLIHSDFYPSNTLIHAGKVTGVLDFEYAGSGYRAMDFAIGMAAFSTRSWSAGPVWPALEGFARGYLARVPLTTTELGAIPDLWLMREVTSFVHFLGRMEQGLTTRDDIEDRERRLLALHRRVTAYQGPLRDRLSQLARHS